MSNVMEKVVKMFWHDSDDTNVKATEGKSGKFDLMLGTLLVGTLLYSNNMWQFSYSDMFRGQSQYAPLANFPSKEKIYESAQLWPFFASRLPGNAQLGSEAAGEDIVDLLKKYGSHVITNPYVLA